ncbi:MAG: hypothetical protein H8D46_01825, partial [FCB group bacterium]|nr:hypothetical protein [FCB group bacterium]
MKIQELLQNLNLDTFISLDLETTGLTPGADGITEISAYKFVHGEPSEEYTTLVNPGVPIPDEIVELTNITNEMVKDAPDITSVLPDLIEFIGDIPVVGHMISFDLSFIEYFVKESGLTFKPGKVYDTLLLSRTFLFFHHEFNLSGVSQFFNFSADGAHRAGADTLNAGKIFVNLIHEAASYPVDIIQVLYDAARHTELYNLHLFKDIIKCAVESRSLNGLVTSEIQKEIKDFWYEYTSTNENANLELGIPGWFAEDGILSKHWDHYEPRPTQRELAQDVYNTFSDGNLHLAEAGTGLGKSLAYLSAGLLSRKQIDIPLLVSTYTKNLQDQLFYKDVPALAEAIDIDTRAVLLKGRQNYICKTRLNHVLSHSESLLSEQDCENLLPILIWITYTRSGDVSECNGFMKQRAGRLWSILRSEAGFCTGYRCDKNDGCYLRKIRDSVSKADIIIVNHALLLSDLLQDNSNLPPTFSYVIDEGHNLEKSAKDQLINTVNERSIIDIADGLSLEKSGYQEEINLLHSLEPKLVDMMDQINVQISPVKADIQQFFSEYAQRKADFVSAGNSNYETTFVYPDGQNEFAGLEITPEHLISSFRDLISFVNAYLDKARDLPESKNAQYIQELILKAGQAESLKTILDRIYSVDKEDIVWSALYKMGSRNYISLNCAPRDVSSFIARGVLTREAGGVVCSATLTVNYSFTYLSEITGVNQLPPERVVTEKIYHSPFHYEDQMKLFAFSSDVNVNSPDYLKAVAHQIDHFTAKYPLRMLV